ncbi:MAG: VOC family protein, partial [Dongiaceae bacterium]
EGVVLALYDAGKLAKDLGRKLDGGTARFTLAHNARSRDEVDRIFRRAEGAGARTLQPPQATSWGGYSGHFADPEGHVWEIAWNPHFPFAPDGSIVIPE